MRWSPGSVSKSEVKRKVEPTARLEKSRLARFAKKSGGDSGSCASKRSKSAVGGRFVIAYVLSIRIPACPPSGPRRAFRGTIGRRPGYRGSAFILNGDLDLQPCALAVGIDCRPVIRICEWK